MKVALATAAVVASMVTLFLLPPGLFVAGTFGATSVMAVSAYFMGGFASARRVGIRGVVLGLVSAAALYGVFFVGNAGLSFLNLPGAGTSSERSIYSLISSPSNPFPLQVAVLAFDAVGYESFFRGVLQARLTPRLGVGAAPVVALADAAIHIATLNPLWVGTTFIADLVWGLTYHYGRGFPSGATSHFVWDLAIFIIRPIT